MAKKSQEDLDRRLAELGGSRLSHGVASQKQIKNPNYNPDDLRSTEPENLTLDVQQWRSPEGHILQAMQMPDGSWEIVRDEPPTPKPATASSDPNDPKNRNEAALQAQRERNAALPADQDPAYETDEERRKRAADRIAQQGRDAKAAEDKARQDRIDQEARDQRNKPGAPTLKPDGKGGTVAVQTMPDGSIRTTPLPGVPSDRPQPVRVTVNGTVYERGDDGVYAPAAGLPTAEDGTKVDLAGAPQLDLSSPERARATYRELFLFVDRQVREGKLTAEKAKAYLVGPHQAVADMLAEATEQRQSAEGLRRDQLTERSQDMTQAGNRLQFSQNAAQNAIRTSGDLIKAAEGGESTIVPLMVLQAGMGQAMGGFRESPSVAMPSGLMPRVAEQAGAGFAVPSAVGVPSAEHAAGIMANPVFRPAPTVTADDPMTAPVAPAAPAGPAPSATRPAAAPAPVAPAVPAPPSAPSGPPERDNWRNDPSTPPINMDPSQGPVGVMPDQILRSGRGARTADDLERELLAEGYSMQEIRAARQRAMARAGLSVAV